MKNKKSSFALVLIALSAGAYIIKKKIRTAKERIFRIAAGESDYERTHKKK